ncbi:MAG TPA: divergent polysaccharide deacetylase family protein [Candidatus Baltobacteraceae bacterium]
MPKRNARDEKRVDYIALAIVLLAAIALGWWLLAPRRAHHPKSVSVVTPAPSLPQATSAPAVPATTVPTSAPATLMPSPLPTTTPHAVAGAPRLALIVDDCGQWIDTERGFLALSIPLTMSVLPDVHYTSTIATEAAGAGKGVMLHLPMETLSGLNPGPGKVTTEMSDSQIAQQVEADLAQIPLAAGVNNHEGSKASADERVMDDVVDVLAKHGHLFFIDSRTNAASVGERVAESRGVPTASRDVFLDNQASVDYTVAQLKEAAAIARKNGSAIAIGHPRPTTLQAVRDMIPQLQASGIEFVLARDLVSSDPR